MSNENPLSTSTFSPESPPIPDLNLAEQLEREFRSIRSDCLDILRLHLEPEEELFKEQVLLQTDPETKKRRPEQELSRLTLRKLEEIAKEREIIHHKVSPYLQALETFWKKYPERAVEWKNKIAGKFLQIQQWQDMLGYVEFHTPCVDSENQKGLIKGNPKQMQELKELIQEAEQDPDPDWQLANLRDAYIHPDGKWRDQVGLPRRG